MRRVYTDIVVTAVTQAAVMMATFLLYGLIARFFGPTGIGEYTIMRRALYFLQPVILIGVTVAVPRYIAISTDLRARRQIARIGFFSVLVCSLVVALTAFGMRDWLSEVMFRRPDAQDLVAAFALLTVAFGLHSFVYSYYRGTRDMFAANRLDLVNSFVMPLIALASSVRLGMGTMIAVTAALMIGATAGLSGTLWRDIWSSLREPRGSPGLTRKVLSYGLPRIPGDLALAGLLFGGAYIVARQASIREAGYFGVAQTLLMFPGAALAAPSIVLLPYVSERLAAGDVASVQANGTRLVHAIADGAVYFSLHVVLFADVILRLWLGKAMMGAAVVVRILMVSVPFYAIYLVFRSVIDAATHRPVTTVNLVVAFACFAAFYVGLEATGIDPSRAAAWALSAAFVVLGGLTISGVARHVGIPGFFDTGTQKVLGLNLAIAAAVFVARLLAEGRDWVWIAVEGLCVMLFVLGLIWQKRSWFMELLAYLPGRSSIFRR